MEEDSSSPEEDPEGDPEAELLAKGIFDLKLQSKTEDHKSHMERLREREGLGLPLRLEMERSLARQLGMKLMDDVLTGRYESIGIEDFVELPEHSDKHFQPRSKGEMLFNTRSKS